MHTFASRTLHVNEFAKKRSRYPGIEITRGYSASSHFPSPMSALEHGTVSKYSDSFFPSPSSERARYPCLQVWLTLQLINV